MISANAIASIEWMFEKALRDNCVLGQDNRFDVTSLAYTAPTAENRSHRLVVLNISSYAFRIVALFDFDTDAATLAHLARIMHREEAFEEQALLDAFGEFTNRVCGEVNRGFSANFRHEGMSTPFFLENSCLGYLEILKPSQIRLLKVAIDDSVRFEVVICICVNGESSLDFKVDRSVQEKTSSGELELF